MDKPEQGRFKTHTHKYPHLHTNISLERLFSQMRGGRLNRIGSCNKDPQTGSGHLTRTIRFGPVQSGPVQFNPIHFSCLASLVMIETNRSFLSSWSRLSSPVKIICQLASEGSKQFGCL